VKSIEISMVTSREKSQSNDVKIIQAKIVSFSIMAGVKSNTTTKSNE